MANKGTLTQYFKWGTNNVLTTTATQDTADLAAIFDWSITKQSVINNYSEISYAFKIKNISLANFNTNNSTEYTKVIIGGTGSDSTFKDLVITIGGAQALTRDNISIEVAVGSTVTIGSGTKTIYHSYSDGTSEPSVRVDFYVDGTEGWTSYNRKHSIAGSMGLDSIARHALIYDAPHFNDEESPTITYAVPSGMTAYAYIALDGQNEDIAARAITGEGEYQFVFTEAEKAKLWTIQNLGLATKAVRFYVRTEFNGTVYYEYLSRNLTIVNYTPTLNPEVWDSNTDCVNRLTGNQYILVKGVSNASFTTGGAARKGATIDSQTTFNAGIPKYGASGTFDKVTENIFEFSITDSYGRTTPATMEFSKASGRFIDYVKLTCSVEVTDMTADGDVQVKITGKCFNGSFGKKTNRLRVFYNIAQNNSDEFEHVDLGYADYASNYGNSYSVSGNDYTYTLNISGLEYLSVYDFTVWVADEVSTEGVSAFTVLASTPIFDWGRTDFAFNVPVTIQGADVPSLVAQVNSDSGWSYRKWSDGTAECWRTLSVTTAVATSTNANWYSSGELSATNLSFPFTFAARPSVTVQTMPTGSSWCIVFPSNTTGSTTKTGSYQLNSMSSTASRNHLLSYDVKGRWK